MGSVLFAPGGVEHGGGGSRSLVKFLVVQTVLLNLLELGFHRVEKETIGVDHVLN